jgi:hypothetical protein
MKYACTSLLVILELTAGLLISNPALAQQTDKFLPNKAGSWTIISHEANGLSQAELIAFDENLGKVAGWFHANNAILANPKGFDMQVDLWKESLDRYKEHACNYGYQAAIDFVFQLFIIENGMETRWTIEPPHWEMDINNTSAGHGSNFNKYQGYRVQIDDPKMEAPIEKTVFNLSELFLAFPVVKEIAPGITLYGDGNLVISNPSRPPYWIPVKVKEVLELMLANYKLTNEFVYNYVKAEYDKMSPEILNAWASDGSEDGVLNANGQNLGLPIMRFNKEYWDRSLPPSAVQLITLYYLPPNQDRMLEYMQNNGHPDYAQKVMDAMQLSDIGLLIQKK